MHSRLRRFGAALSLALFILGGNFCSFSGGPALAGGVSSLAKSPVHACCVARAKRAAHAADATRESTAPCCVTIAPIVGAHAPTLDATPAVIPTIAAIAIELDPAPPVALALAAREDARPPDRFSATPDTGRAPPRL